jgi:hypothetical protein
MGGHALKKVSTSRKSPEDYQKIKDYVLQILFENLGSKYAVPHEVPGKESYGDLDVLIAILPEFKLHEWIIKTFQPDEIVSNGGVYSFNIANEFNLARDFQIDFISTTMENFAVHHFFLSYGDCGMLIGQITHTLRIRFGQQGLFTHISTRTGMSDDLILSKDPMEICKFLGLDFNLWNTGFSREDDIFSWLYMSPYLKNVDFVRARRGRGMYMRFIDFLNSRKGFDEVNPCGFEEIPTLNQVITYFGKEAELTAIQKKQENVRRRSEKFNAGLFAELELTGKELGKAIARFKNTIPGDFQDWVLATDSQEIQERVSQFIAESRSASSAP